MRRASSTRRVPDRTHMTTPALAVLAVRLGEVALAEAHARRYASADRWRRLSETYRVELAVRGFSAESIESLAAASLSSLVGVTR